MSQHAIYWDRIVLVDSAKDVYEHFFFLFSLNIFISWSIFGELRHFFYGRLSGKIDWFVFFFLENFQVDDYDRIILYLYLLITKNINIYILLHINVFAWIESTGGNVAFGWRHATVALLLDTSLSISVTWHHKKVMRLTFLILLD